MGKQETSDDDSGEQIESEEKKSVYKSLSREQRRLIYDKIINDDKEEVKLKDLCEILFNDKNKQKSSVQNFRKKIQDYKTNGPVEKSFEDFMHSIGKLQKRGPKNKAQEDEEQRVKEILAKYKSVNDPSMLPNERAIIDNFKTKFDCPEKKIQRLRASIYKSMKNPSEETKSTVKPASSKILKKTSLPKASQPIQQPLNYVPNPYPFQIPFNEFPPYSHDYFPPRNVPYPSKKSSSKSKSSSQKAFINPQFPQYPQYPQYPLTPKNMLYSPLPHYPNPYFPQEQYAQYPHLFYNSFQPYPYQPYNAFGPIPQYPSYAPTYSKKNSKKTDKNDKSDRSEKSERSEKYEKSEKLLNPTNSNESTKSTSKI